jgi:hypothetical protein
MGPTVAQALVQLSHENDVVAIVTMLNPSCSYVYWCKFCIHL